jgi:hypothetical protein
MKNLIPATLSVALIKLYPRSTITKITLAAVLAAGIVFSTGVSHGDVKFSKPVVMLTGTVHAVESGKVISVKVSIRSTDNRDEEITSSVSNSESGKYLVILAPNKQYLVRLQNAAGVMKEETIRTPRLNDMTIKIERDFAVKTAE